MACCGAGPKRADWLVIGEVPGARRIGAASRSWALAGQLLDAMLKAIGLDRTRNVYIANVLKSRPPNNRDPRLQEVEACLPYLVRQIALLRPKIKLAVGRIARAENLLGTDVSFPAVAWPGASFRRGAHVAGGYLPSRLPAAHPERHAQGAEDLKFARSVYQQPTGSSG